MDDNLPRNRDDFHVAVFCAMAEEADEVDKIFDKDLPSYGKHPRDTNSYSLGRIGKHNVVLVHLRKKGLTVANAAAVYLCMSFQKIKLAFVVGICGIIPNINGNEAYLGDFVISTGVIQYDYGYQHHTRHVRKDTIEKATQGLSAEAGNLIAKLRTGSNLKRVEDQVVEQLRQKIRYNSLVVPEPNTDCLYRSSYNHYHAQPNPNCKDCQPHLKVCRKPCKDIPCNKWEIQRILKKTRDPRLHFGVIGSANTLMRSGKHRELVVDENNVIAFEMEGCGVWDDCPTIILRAASDYADSHKSDIWQAFAMAVAACALKAVLGMLDHSDQVPYQSPPSPQRTMSDSSAPSYGTRRYYMESPASPGGQSSRPPAQITAGPSTYPHIPPALTHALSEPYVHSYRKFHAQDGGSLPAGHDQDQELIEYISAQKKMATASPIEVDEIIQKLQKNADLIIIGKNEDEYWSHMTLEAYWWYDRLYEILAENEGEVDIWKFVSALGPYLPSPEETLSKWRRFRRGVGKLPKPYVMALLYMLHLEHFRSRHSSKRPILDDDLLGILQSFDKWVLCPCGKCKLLWNFISTNWGWCKDPAVKGAENCLLYRRCQELEENRSQTSWTTLRKPEEIIKSNELREQCYQNWWYAGEDMTGSKQ